MRNVIAAAFGRPDEARLVDRLRADGDSVISLVAFDQNEIIGHVLFSRLATPFPALALGPASVAPDRQRKGIGSRLIRAGLERAAKGAWRAVFVLGDPRYYRRFGFDPPLAASFTCRYAGPHLMALPLGGALTRTGGVIEYAAAFASLA